MWEKIEHENLLKDRNRKLKIMELDKEFLDAESQKLLDEEERHIEDMINQREDIFDDEFKDIVVRALRVEFIGRLFSHKEEWRSGLYELKEFKVIKMPRVMQSVMYLLEYRR
mmetsp:Transcript_5218/g.3940  ORF Transcript_5218/g.3940 Transcript_5218/m.3940 type:complete len:112 (+) Transcript_5218:982-1317(+)